MEEEKKESRRNIEIRATHHVRHELVFALPFCDSIQLAFPLHSNQKTRTEAACLETFEPGARACTCVCLSVCV